MKLRPYVQRHPRMSVRGFTLVELLVVVAITATLAAIILIVVGRVRGSANMARDMTSMRDIGTAIAQYASENNNRLPVNPKYSDSHGVARIPIPEDLANNTGSFCRFELIDRYLPRDGNFPQGSWYAFQKRANSPWISPSARAYPGWNKQAAYPNLTGPLAFAFNPQIENDDWEGFMSKIPGSRSYVILAEQNDSAANNVDPGKEAVTEPDVKTRYRHSHPGGKGLYLFTDYHIEAIAGSRHYGYYTEHPDEPNIWKWWK
jgi:prepilin-type N-terminal cleavage/methylation domain-containing protein